MSDLDYWTAALRKAEQELDAAATRTAINAAAKKLQLAKAELKRLQQAPTHQASGVALAAASS